MLSFVQATDGLAQLIDPAQDFRLTRLRLPVHRGTSVERGR